MSVIIRSIVAYLTNRPKKQPIFWSIRAKTGDWPKFFRLFLVNRGRCRSRQATAPRRNIAPKRHLCDTVATVWRQCRIGVALGIWGGQVPFPIFAWRTKKSRLHNSFTASEALSAKRGNDTCPYIPTCSISPQLSVLLWDLPPADSTSPCAAAWDRWEKTARNALGAPSGNAGSRSDSR